MNHYKMKKAKIDELAGKVPVKIEGMENGSQEVLIYTENEVFSFQHEQNCCESVQVEDVIGDPADLIGRPLLMAEEETNKENQLDKYDDLFLWTFYKFATINGYVTVRWYGCSNGYYSVDVNLYRKNLPARESD